MIFGKTKMQKLQSRIGIKFALFPTKLTCGRWVWLENYYRWPGGAKTQL